MSEMFNKRSVTTIQYAFDHGSCIPTVVRQMPQFEKRFVRVELQRRGNTLHVVCRKCKGCDVRATCINAHKGGKQHTYEEALH
jgi:hypothetical protein